MLTADGRPLAEATVRIKNRQLDQPSRAEGFVAFEGTDELRTGRDGRFNEPLPLPMGYEFRARAEAFGFEPAETEWVANPKGDMPDLRLHMAVGVRAGGRARARRAGQAGRRSRGLPVRRRSPKDPRYDRRRRPVSSSRRPQRRRGSSSSRKRAFTSSAGASGQTSDRLTSPSAGLMNLQPRCSSPRPIRFPATRARDRPHDPGRGPQDSRRLLSDDATHAELCNCGSC